ncbi:MAG: hypothetical protein OXU77_00215 [Gammaproteobacteria bacterium]|nr:hypothetical protein [Gammaproteobacteria bacterium]
MSILLGYAGCTLAACVILLEFRAVRRLMADTKRMDAVFGPLVTPGRAQERVVEDEQGPLDAPAHHALRVDVGSDIRHPSEV